MLEVLCGRRWDSYEVISIFDEIDAREASNTYSSNFDFPFLGRRLLELQRFTRAHDPTSLQALWYDRRNISWWYTFWVSQRIINYLELN